MSLFSDHKILLFISALTAIKFATQKTRKGLNINDEKLSLSPYIC